MGYILPINNEQSIQYVNRKTSYKSNYIELNHITKPSLNTQFNHHQSSSQKRSQLLSKRQELIVEKVKAELTGIGMLFNEKI